MAEVALQTRKGKVIQNVFHILFYQLPTVRNVFYIATQTTQSCVHG